MNILYTILLALLLSWVFSGILNRLKLPSVLSPLIVGIILGLQQVKDIVLADSINLEVLSLFADIGLIFLMFYVGFELNIKQMVKTRKRSYSISFFSAISTLALGFLIGKLFGFSNLVSVILGFSISIANEAIAVNILDELGMLKSRLGSIILTSGIIDDIVGIFLIAVVVALTGESNFSPIYIIPILILVAFLVLFVYRYLLPALLLMAEKKNIETNIFMISVIMALIFSLLSELLGFGFILGALVAGFLMNNAIEERRKVDYKESRKDLFKMSAKEFKTLKKKMTIHDTTLNTVKTTAFGFLVPFFFIWIGLNVDLSLFIESPLLICALTIAAIVGKLIGSTVGNMLAGGSSRTGFLIGWALNGRAFVELVFAEIARATNIISSEVFSAIVFMSILTSLISPAVFNYLVRKK
ncbi:cation:proton antiporter [Nanoarchaeota archaeon]